MKLVTTWEIRCHPSGALGFSITTTDGFTVGYMLSPLSRLKISKVRAIRLAALTTGVALRWGCSSTRAETWTK